jgi:hypothetical protein
LVASQGVVKGLKPAPTASATADTSSTVSTTWGTLRAARPRTHGRPAKPACQRSTNPAIDTSAQARCSIRSAA